MVKSQIFFYFCLAFLGGIFLNSFFEIPQLLLLGFLLFGILLISVFWKYKNLAVAGFCFLFLVLGLWRYQSAEHRIEESKLTDLNQTKETVTLIGIVSAEPDIRETNVRLTINELVEVKDQPIEGRVLVTTNKYLEYQYGDRLKISGELLTPQEFEDFNYRDYLAKDGVYSTMYYPEMELVEKNQGNFIFAELLKFKNKLRESVYRNLSPPQSSILGAIILGDKRQISDEWKEKLNFTGVRHLTAVSGMHVAVLTAILMSFLIGLGFWRGQAFYFTLILIFLFVLMTGLQSSAIRAGIMGGFFLLAQYLGRGNSSLRALIFAALIMLVQNPLLLRFDVGFQLSFLAVLGIIYLGPVFQDWFRKIPNPFQLRNIVAITFSAQIFTLPILIYNFGYFSLVSPFTNVLILPLLPYLMILGFLSGLLGIVWQSLGWLVSLPAWLLLTYLTKIVDWFSSLPFAVYFLEISWIWLVITYLMLGFLVWRLQKGQKLKFLNY